VDLVHGRVRLKNLFARSPRYDAGGTEKSSNETVYTLDTNAIIYYLHAEESVCVFIDTSIRNASPLYMSVITEAELFRFPGLPPHEESAIIDLLPAFSIVPLDSYIARMAGALGRVHNLKLADSIIAATALFTGTTLVTRNARDFRRVHGLSVEKI